MKASVFFVLIAGFTHGALANPWFIPMGGNAFRVAPQGASGGLENTRGIICRTPEDNFVTYFHINRNTKLKVGIEAITSSELFKPVVKIEGQEFTSEVAGNTYNRNNLGDINVNGPKYIRVDISCGASSPTARGSIRHLIVQAESDNAEINYVRNNQNNMFLWGRRGPSVHFNYSLSKYSEYQYAYSEVTVPPSMDAVGSFFMANGFAEGYFGIQVNSPTERKVLFSVWSPFQTDRPSEIPANARVELISKGAGVVVKDFGGEGSGGQSYLVFPWEAGKTYRFLTEVKPIEQGRTQYTSWFMPDGADQWQLIASFSRPQTQTFLKGFHSFLENFDPNFGNLQREARYKNIWVITKRGDWREARSAELTVDDTGRSRQRLDFTGFSDGDAFVLRNGGFFAPSGKPDTTYSRDRGTRPVINFESLPR